MGETIRVLVGLAQFDEDSGWIQILVFVVMAVLYGLASIARARSEAASRSKQGNDLQAEQAGASGKKKSGPARRPVVRRPATGVRTTELPPPPPRLPSLPQIMPPEMQPSRPEIAADLPLQPIAKLSAYPAFEFEAETGLLGTPAITFTSPEQLAQAIIHYEIFGPPLALRDHPPGSWAAECL